MKTSFSSFTAQQNFSCKNFFKTAKLRRRLFSLFHLQFPASLPKNPQYHSQNSSLVSLKIIVRQQCLVPAYSLVLSATIPRQPPFGTSLDSFVCLLVHVPSPTPLTNFTSPHFIRLLDQLRNQFVARRLLHSCDFNNCTVVFWDGLANAHRLTEFEHNTTTDTATTHRITEGAETEVRRHTRHTQLSCRRQGSPTSIDYRSGERARITMKPQTKCARSQGTTSPQISVTFRHFSYQPIIWHRGPRPRAHWYMCADATNSQNYHTYCEGPR